jgi:hypothetical protein
MRRTILPTFFRLRHHPEGGDPAPGGPQPTPTPPAPTRPATGEDGLGDAGKAAIKAERDARKAADDARKAAEKERDEFRNRLQALEDKDKSELEKATARLAELEQSYTTERATRLRLQIASEFEIGKDDLVLLTATDEDGLRAQAERVKARNDAAAGRPPAPLPGQGTPPAAPKTGSVSAGADEYRRKKQTAT